MDIHIISEKLKSRVSHTKTISPSVFTNSEVIKFVQIGYIRNMLMSRQTRLVTIVVFVRLIVTTVY